MAWHPRGAATWPGFKTAPAGTRVRHVRTGRLGTFVRLLSQTRPAAVVDWDAVPNAPGPGGVSRGTVVAPGFDLEVVPGTVPDPDCPFCAPDEACGPCRAADAVT